MAKARQIVTPGPKVADKPKENGLIVDFLRQGRLLILFFARLGRPRGF
jgi:hypothetical protein